VARDEIKAGAKASRAMGSAPSHDVPVAMMGKLPLRCKTLALSLYRDFDTIVMDADGIGMPKQTLGQVADALQKCVACHNPYQVKRAQGQSPGPLNQMTLSMAMYVTSLLVPNRA